MVKDQIKTLKYTLGSYQQFVDQLIKKDLSDPGKLTVFERALLVNASTWGIGRLVDQKFSCNDPELKKDYTAKIKHLTDLLKLL